ncbi:cysteine protease ATG4D isoform X5 [Corvus moneduloides]|uniref:cysteine protease ATG4D isoform X5 n=1 Tax=Corvus moneduloides TaxID=1196302 RepID=UPI00136235B6|nr:cysteine protease ATG4D isoform X5 [Corvus moneduloides]
MREGGGTGTPGHRQRDTGIRERDTGIREGGGTGTPGGGRSPGVLGSVGCRFPGPRGWGGGVPGIWGCRDLGSPVTPLCPPRLDAAAAAPLQPAGPPVPAGQGLRAGERGGAGAVPAGFLLPPVVHVPQRLPRAARDPPDHGLRLGLHPAQRPDAAGPGARAAPAGPGVPHSLPDWTWPEALLELEPGGTRRSRDPPGRTRDGPRVPRDGHGSPRPDTGSPGWTRDPLGCTQDPPGRMRPPQNGQGPPGVDTGRPRMDTESLGGTRDPSGQARDPPGKLRDSPGRTRPPPGSPRALRDAEQRHRAIVSWFSDHPRAPFGIHRLVELGREFGKSAGDWFGPAIAAHLLRLVRGDPEGGTAGPGAPGHGAPGASGHGTPGSGTPGAPGQRRGLVLLVPARLGGESLNPVYVECVKELLQLRSCLGIIGGKPRHSLFFLGFQGDSLLYLDPHLCQASVDTAREKFPLQSFHCCFPRKMPFGKMDPSCTFGFYAGGTELEQLWGDLARVLAPPSAPERYPIFTLAEGHAQDQALDTPPGPPPSLPRRGKRPKKPNSDEFVFL